MDLVITIFSSVIVWSTRARFGITISNNIYVKILKKFKKFNVH
jgi:hypothetical protein